VKTFKEWKHTLESRQIAGIRYAQSVEDYFRTTKTSPAKTIDSKAGEMIITKAKEAQADPEVGNNGFVAFAKHLGLSVDGSKKQMMDQFMAYVRSAAWTHTWTHL
jgi:hypothetical protein